MHFYIEGLLNGVLSLTITLAGLKILLCYMFKVFVKSRFVKSRFYCSISILVLCVSNHIFVKCC